MNVVMNDRGDFIEIQGTAEGHPFRQDELNAMLESFQGDTAAGALTLEDFQNQVNALADQVPLVDQLDLTDEQIEQLRGMLVSGAAWVGSVVVNLGMSIPELIAKLFIFLAIVGVERVFHTPTHPLASALLLLALIGASVAFDM